MPNRQQQGMIDSIETKRLRLELLSIGFLEAIVGEDIERGGRLVSFHISSGTSMIGKPWVSRRLKMILKDRSQHRWMYRAIVRKSDSEMVGFISFHHKFPDPDLSKFSENGVELGYTIEEEYRRLGYARESILEMIQWARKEHREAEIFVTISPQNEASMKLAESLSFRKAGEHEDDIDGLEYVMKYPIHVWQR